MSDEITTALISLGGVALAAIVQWLVSRSTVRSETERLHRQLSSEFNFQQLSEWNSQFRKIISDLLAATDPEVNPVPDKKQIVPLVLCAQLMLDPNLPEHATVNSLINQLALKINGWHGESDISNLLVIHGKLLDSSRELMFRPRKSLIEG